MEWTTIKVTKEKSERINKLTPPDRKKEYVTDEILELALSIKESEQKRKLKIQLDY